jgi:poly(3-hydroxybutyrate) depolymerase
MSIVSLAVPIALAIATAAQDVQKLTFESSGRSGTYYLYVPAKASPGPAPVIVLLHGSGGDGKSMIDPWLPLARSEGIILVAPDASYPQAWRIPQEGPQFFHDLLEGVRASHRELDDRRMFLQLTK